NNRKLTLHFKAALRAGITESDAIVFPQVEYTIKGEVVIDRTDFDDRRENGWKASGSTLISHGFGQGVGAGYSKYLQCNSGGVSSLEKVYPANLFVAGRNYRIRIDIKNSNAIGYVQGFAISAYHENGQRSWKSFSADRDWSSVILAFPALSSGSIRIEIEVYGNQAGTYFIDNITVLQV
ncbi:hypothetical protein, partial [Pseudomonas grimontii]|uniref:hypothetical protein n=1 Tax=Pseudomonas grimontii TaxID=129847 RepID=UPI00387B5304